MSGFETDRANRNAARALFERRLAQVKQDLAARGIGGRIADKAKGDALAMADEALAVAKDNKGLIAATIAALAAWAFRKPLIGLVAQLRPGPAPVQPDASSIDHDASHEESVR